MRLLYSLALMVTLQTSAFASEENPADQRFLDLSSKGKAIVASRVFKGQEIILPMMELVDVIDKSLRAHRDAYKAINKCESFEAQTKSHSGTSSFDIEITMDRKENEDKTSCDLKIVTTENNVATPSIWTVTCSLSKKEAETIGAEGVGTFTRAIKTLRYEGRYGNNSPSKTLSAMIDSRACKSIIGN